MSYIPIPMIPPYAGFTQFTPVLPEFYWNVYSAEQRIKHICMELDKLINYADMLGQTINISHDDVDALYAEFEKFKESGFADYYEAQIREWVANNLDALFGQYSRGVYFGLNQDGNFVAYVPESWSDIVFDTGANYALDTYGRLILRMDVDSPYNVDQTPEVVREYDDSPSLQQEIRNLMNSLYNTEER